MNIPPVTSQAAVMPPAQPETTQGVKASTAQPGGAPVETSARPARPNEVGGSTRAETDVKPATAADLQQALEDVQSAIGRITSDLLFSVDQDTGRTVVKIVDRETDEVIKQFPSDEMIRIAKALDKLQGLLVQQEV